MAYRDRATTGGDSSQPLQRQSLSERIRFTKSSNNRRTRGGSQDALNVGTLQNPNSNTLHSGSTTPSSRNTIAFSNGSLRSNSPSMLDQSNSLLTEADSISTTSFVSSKTGFLTKRAMSAMDAFANWKERFFVLAEGHLSYYKQGGGFFNSSKEDIVHLKGELELTPDTVVRKSNIDDKANCFEVITPTKKMFAQAQTAKEMEDWIKSIKAHVQALKNREQNARRGSFQMPNNDNVPGFLPSSAPANNGSNTPGAPILEDYNRRSNIENLISNRTTEKSNDPNDIIIKQLLEENRALREQLMRKDQIIHALETNGLNNEPIAQQVGRNGVSMRSTAPKMILDLRDVKKKQFQLFDAAEVGNWHLIATLLRDNVVDVNGVGVNQMSALHLAAWRNHVNAVKELLSRGAEVSARNGDSYTALHLASRAGHPACVEELLNANADPNATDCLGNGAIHMAAEGGHINVARLLISAGARIDVANASGSLPIHLSPIGHPIRVLLGSGGANLAENMPNRRRVNGNPGENDTEVAHLAFKNKYQKDLALGPRDFEFVRVLGRGAFAKVYLVRGKGSNRDNWYALKAYNKQAIVQKNQAQYIHTEKAALQACSDHPYIVSLYYAFQSQDRLFLVMEYCGGGDLLSALTRRKKFTEPEAAFYIGEIALALSHLHSKNIVFRDLKPENVVMDLDGHCLLTDFGISKEGIKDHTSANTFCGSPMYLAPEMLSRSGHGFALDWYSVGALLFELLTGLPPFYTNDKKQLFHNILRGHLVLPEYLSPSAKDLISKLLHRDPKKRLGSGERGDAEIFEHPFFRTVNWDKLKKRELAPPFRPITKSDPSGIPDTSNFPDAFTEQEISDMERGFEKMNTDDRRTTNGSRGSLSSSRSSRNSGSHFKNFDFTPDLSLDAEAKWFEQSALAENSIKNLPAPSLVEEEEYHM